MQLKFVSNWVDDSINNSSVVISISPFQFRLDSLFFLIYVISIDDWAINFTYSKMFNIK